MKDDNNLSGSLPSELGSLTSLYYLHLHGNDVTGTIPSEIGSLLSLVLLRLDNNELTGTLPSEFGYLTYLQSLQLAYNKIHGTLPTEIGHVTNLRDLSLAYNKMHGTLPTEIGNLTDLEWLTLNNNNLDGVLPTEMGKLRRLEEITAGGNNFVGSLPSEIGFLGRITDLELHDNFFSGTIPCQIGMLLNLRELSLSGNRLTGSIPMGVANFANLEELSLQSNLLEGTFHMENLTGLIDLNLSQNQLSSFSIAQEHTSIRTFDLSGNYVFFEINNDFFYHLRNAQYIILTNNYIHGHLPNIDGRLFNLLHLLVDENCLSGELPVTYDVSMPRLEELRLSYGGEKCRVDQGNDIFDSRGRMGYCFRIEQCRPSMNYDIVCCGNDPEICTPYYYSDGCGEVECIGFCLYRVGLWGSLPPSFSQFSNLRVLHLANNLLAGEIPAGFGDGLRRMVDFDIRNNYFDGRIPAAIASIGSSTEATPTISLGGNRFNESLLAPLQLCLFEEEFDLYHENETWCPRERNIMYHFFDASKGQEWTNSSRWIDQYEPHCAWHGITCHENNISVKMISLGNNGLSGSITTQISGLGSLEKLDVSDNNLQGSIPRTLSNLLALSDIRLSYNSLTGNVPELQRLKNLTVLYLHSNRLQGEVHIESQNVTDAIADCGSPSDFKEPLGCPSCTYCCNYLGECDENSDENRPSLLFGECGEESSERPLGLHINGCSVQEGAVFIIYIIVACIMTCFLSVMTKKMCNNMLASINWQEFNLGRFMGENSVYVFILSSSCSGWIIAVSIWIFQIYVYFLFVDASQKDLSNETDWLYRYRCPRNAGDEDETCEETTSVTEIGQILGIIIMVLNLFKDLICGIKLIWIVPRRDESIQKRMRCLIGATLLFTVSSFAIYSSVVYNQATATRDTDFIYNSVVLIFLNSVDEWCFAAVRVICPSWLKAILKEIDINPEDTARQHLMENMQSVSEEIKEENENIKVKCEEVENRIEDIKEESRREKEEMTREIEASKKEIEEIKEESRREKEDSRREMEEIKEENRREIEEIKEESRREKEEMTREIEANKRGNKEMEKELEELKRQITFLCRAELQSESSSPTHGRSISERPA